MSSNSVTSSASPSPPTITPATSSATSQSALDAASPPPPNSAPPSPPSASTWTSPTALANTQHNLSLFLLVSTPVLLALPPRKLDLYTFGLFGLFIGSANHLTVERTGGGLIDLAGKRLEERRKRLGAEDEQMQNAVERWRHQNRNQKPDLKEIGPRLGIPSTRNLGADGSVLARVAAQSSRNDSSGAKEQEQEGRKEAADGVLARTQQLFTANEPRSSSWKENRLREEREALEEGKGYGDIIMEQIWEVWNWGGKGTGGGRKDGEGGGRKDGEGDGEEEEGGLDGRGR